MDKKVNDYEIIQNGSIVKFYMKGVEVKGIQSIRYENDIDSIPYLKLEMVPYMGSFKED